MTIEGNRHLPLNENISMNIYGDCSSTPAFHLEVTWWVGLRSATNKYRTNLCASAHCRPCMMEHPGISSKILDWNWPLLANGSGGIGDVKLRFSFPVGVPVEFSNTGPLLIAWPSEPQRKVIWTQLDLARLVFGSAFLWFSGKLKGQPPFADTPKKDPLCSL